MAEPQTPPPEYLTVRELAELLRIKERKVYDLAAAGAVPCSRVTGKLIFPERAVRAWIDGASTGAAAPVTARRPAIFLGSHDPLLEWALRQSRCGIATFFDGSLDGLARFRAGEGLATAMHVRDAASGTWNVPAVCADGDIDAVLVGWAMRRRGLIIRAEDTAVIGSLADLAGRRVVQRQAGSGTETLLEALLADAGLDAASLTLVGPTPSETDAVASVAQGAADAAFGLEALATLYGLSFVPVIDERFDLLVCRRAWFDAPFQRLLDFCRGDVFRGHAAGLRGYDVSGLGEVRWNA